MGISQFILDASKIAEFQAALTAEIKIKDKIIAFRTSHEYKALFKHVAIGFKGDDCIEIIPTLSDILRQKANIPLEILALLQNFFYSEVLEKKMERARALIIGKF